MPAHDWTRVLPGTFHHFHTSWITHLAESLNGGLLPREYYALAEQHAGQVNPDVLTLTTRAAESSPDAPPPQGAIAVAEAAPKVSLRMHADEATMYRMARRTLSIRHRSSRRIVALIEVVSPADKDRSQHLDQFIDKVVAAIQRGIHVLLIDVHPPSAFDPDGIHGVIWDIVGGVFALKPEEPLVVVSYLADRLPEAFVETIAVGQPLPTMPLFLSTRWYIEVPLETAYQAAYAGLPWIIKEILEGRAAPEA